MSGIHKFISPRANLDFMWMEEKINRRSRGQKKEFYAFWNFLMSFLRFKVFVHLWDIFSSLCVFSLSSFPFLFLLLHRVFLLSNCVLSRSTMPRVDFKSHTLFVKSDWIKIAGKNPYRIRNRLNLSSQPYFYIPSCRLHLKWFLAAFVAFEAGGSFVQHRRGWLQ